MLCVSTFACDDPFLLLLCAGVPLCWLSALDVVVVCGAVRRETAGAHNIVEVLLRGMYRNQTCLETKGSTLRQNKPALLSAAPSEQRSSLAGARALPPSLGSPSVDDTS